MAGALSCCANRVVTADDLSLAYIGGRVRSFLVLLSYFCDFTEMYLSTYFGRSVVQFGLFWWLGGFPGLPG